MKTHIVGGGNSFAEMEDIVRIGKKVRCEDKTFAAGGPILWSDGKQAYVLDDDRHTFIIGATASGKTHAVILPKMVTIAKKGESMIIHDPKGELYKHTKPLLDQKDYHVIVLNFSDPMSGNRWNPCIEAYKHYKAGNLDRSSMIIDDIKMSLISRVESEREAFWHVSAGNYFSGLFKIVRNEGEESDMTIENIMALHTDGNEQFAGSTYLQAYCSMLDKNNEIVSDLSGTINTAKETKGGIDSVFSAPLALFAQSGIRDMMSTSDFSLNQIGKRKTAVYLITPDERTTFNPIVSMFIKLCYGALIETSREKENDACLPVRTHFVIDEFCNLPAIADMNQMISAARSRGIKFHLSVQSLPQLYRTYTRETAENIIANCGIKYVLRSSDSLLHNRVSEWGGHYLSEYTHTKRLLVEPTTIQRLPKGGVVIFTQGEKPFYTKFLFFDEYSFNLPKARDVFIPVREPREGTQFDSKDKIRTLKRNRLFESLEKENNYPNVEFGIEGNPEEKVDKEKAKEKEADYE